MCIYFRSLVGHRTYWVPKRWVGNACKHNVGGGGGRPTLLLWNCFRGFPLVAKRRTLRTDQITPSHLQVLMAPRVCWSSSKANYMSSLWNNHPRQKQQHIRPIQKANALGKGEATVFPKCAASTTWHRAMRPASWPGPQLRASASVAKSSARIRAGAGPVSVCHMTL